jgi:DNA-binding CsgD family transcriptional regulator
MVVGVDATVRAAGLLLAVDPGDLGRAPEVAADMESVLDVADAATPPAVLRVLLSVALAAGHLATARALSRLLADSARSAGDVTALVGALARSAFCDHSLGRWNVAYATADEARRLASAAHAPDVVGELLHLTADIDAARGRADACRDACVALRAMADRQDDPVLHALADRREGSLLLSCDDPGAAVPRFESAAQLLAVAGQTHPFFSPAPELAEAYVRLERAADARRVADAFLEHVGSGAPPTARARALRLQGLLATDSDYDEAFCESAALDELTGLRYPLARTLLLHGERLRRDRRRVDARIPLERALDLFRGLEAAPWAERAERELAACGVVARVDAGKASSAALTPQELQIGLMVKKGLRNREIAAAMYVSVRTVEFHLSSAYRKLGVSTRTQLAAVLLD